VGPAGAVGAADAAAAGRDDAPGTAARRLTGKAAADLVAALAGGRPDRELLRLADDAAGNPLYITWRSSWTVAFLISSGSSTMAARPACWPRRLSG
jgi:hypothetical protein